MASHPRPDCLSQRCAELMQMQAQAQTQMQAQMQAQTQTQTQKQAQTLEPGPEVSDAPWVGRQR